MNSGLARWYIMAVNKCMDAAAEIWRNPVTSKHQIQPEYRKWAGWRGTGRLNPSRETKFSGTYGDRKIFIFPVQLTTSRIDNLTRLIHTLLLLYVMTIHASWEDQCEWHRMTRMTGPDCAVMCNLINIHTYIHTYRRYFQHAHFIPIVGDLQHPFGTTLRFTGPVPADSRQWTPSVRNCVTR